MATQAQIEKTQIERRRTARRLAHHEPREAPVEDFDRIRCQECGRSYPALDGPALLYSLKATCPNCGGGFEMIL